MNRVGLVLQPFYILIPTYVKEPMGKLSDFIREVVLVYVVVVR